ncbi:hypothetical protein QJQ45_018618 [Haematococcus lacustris]|nr:hypothetical protein QJQ45_018618 [Haematococcus lacustris]
MRRGRVVLVDEHRTSRVSSTVNDQQPCERQLNKRRATRPADWKSPVGQVHHRLVRPAYSQQRDQPPEQGALPAKGKEYPGLGYKRLRDKPHKAQQQQHQPAKARAKQLVVFFGAAGIGTRGGWGADAVLRACCKMVCRPRGTDQRRGRVVLVDEHRTSRVSSAVNGQQPCERQLNKRRATRPAGWKPPAGQVEQRLVRPAWSQQRDQPVRGMMWCPVVAPRKPPQAPRSSQAATQPAASEPGPSTPLPTKRSKRTKAEPAAEPNKGKGMAAKVKPAPQPGSWMGCAGSKPSDVLHDGTAPYHVDPAVRRDRHEPHQAGVDQPRQAAQPEPRPIEVVVAPLTATSVAGVSVSVPPARPSTDTSIGSASKPGLVGSEDVQLVVSGARASSAAIPSAPPQGPQPIPDPHASSLNAVRTDTSLSVQSSGREEAGAAAAMQPDQSVLQTALSAQMRKRDGQHVHATHHQPRKHASVNSKTSGKSMYSDMVVQDVASTSSFVMSEGASEMQDPDGSVCSVPASGEQKLVSRHEALLMHQPSPQMPATASSTTSSSNTQPPKGLTSTISQPTSSSRSTPTPEPLHGSLTETAASSKASVQGHVLSAGTDAASSASSTRLHRSVKQNPSRLSLTAGPQADGSNSAVQSARLAMHSNQAIGALHKTVELVMMQESDVFRKVQASMRGISSLAKETTNLEVGRDATGATHINQYVVVKTLGRGSFGKVKLCLNTIDGNLYAVKMVNRSFILKQLQKPQKGLRRRVQRLPSDPHVSGNKMVSTPNNIAHSASNVQLNSSPSPRADRGVQSSFNNVVASSDIINRVASESMSSTANSRASVDEANPLDSIMREIAVLKKLDHPNVVKLLEVIDPPSASYMMLVMEYMERGPVLETKGQSGFSRFPERIALDYIRQTCAGLDYLHYNNVAHGDLKPENLLVSAAGQLKIGDFGSARMMSDSTASSKVSCTPAFQPPEALIGGADEDAMAADVWSLGVCLFCFVYGRLPFIGTCLLDVSNAIRNDSLRFPADVPTSPSLSHLFSRMLDKSPSTRITLPEVMQHPWITDQGRLPLPSLRSLLSPPKVIEVSRNEAQSAIDRSSLVNMLRARLKEKTFAAGEYLFKEGEEAHCVYMIMAGVVEIITQLSTDVDTSALDAMEEQSFSVDLDESFTLDCNNVPAGLNVKDGKVHIDKQKAQDLKARMKGLLMGRSEEYVTEVKGPGQVIGEVSGDTSIVSKHRNSARARDTVVVVKMTEEAFMKALMQQLAEGGDKEDDPMLYSSRNIEEDNSGERGAATGLETIHDDGGDVGSL